MKPLLLAVALAVLAFTIAACDSGFPSETAAPELAAGSQFGKVEKLDVCHLNDNGTYVRIRLADVAYDAHEAHGDGQVGYQVPGDAVPTIFGPDCGVLPDKSCLDGEQEPLTQEMICSPHAGSGFARRVMSLSVVEPGASGVDEADESSQRLRVRQPGRRRRARAGRSSARGRGQIVRGLQRASRIRRSPAECPVLASAQRRFRRRAAR